MPPSRMGWLQAPDRQAVFVCYGSCSNCSDAELERRLVENTPAPRRPPQRSRLSVVLFEPERTPPAFVFTTKTGRQSPEGEVYARSRFSPCSECAVSVPAS